MHNMREEYATYNIRNIREYMHNIGVTYAKNTRTKLASRF